MATQNITLGSDYTLIASDSQNFFLSVPRIGDIVEVATSDTEVIPTENGHELTTRDLRFLDRTRLGSGFVYARSKSGVPVNIRVDTWAVSG